MGPITILGPQRNLPIVAPALERLGIDGPLSVITAGWQEREEEVDELAEHVGRPVTNLRLYHRAAELFRKHPEILEIHHQRQDELKELQRLHRLRLDYALEPARRLLRRPGDDQILNRERRAAEEAMRTLDAHHLERIREIHGAWNRRWSAKLRRVTARDVDEIRTVLEGSAAIAVAGGHVAVLLNRLRLFRLHRLVGDLPVIAWSAGAMALAEKVVLFHDRPPQGAGNAEILEFGLGLYKGVVPLPHASARLRLNDEVRVGLFARRFAPAACIALDEGCWTSWDGRAWTAGEGTRRLTAEGTLEPA